MSLLLEGVWSQSGCSVSQHEFNHRASDGKPQSVNLLLFYRRSWEKVVLDIGRGAKEHVVPSQSETSQNQYRAFVSKRHVA